MGNGRDENKSELEAKRILHAEVKMSEETQEKKSIFNDDENFWKLKIMAFLHDPPNKAFLIAEKNNGHEEYAGKLLEKFSIYINNSDKALWKIAKKGDHISSAEDRFSKFKDGDNIKIDTNWKSSPILKHPLESTDKKFNLISLATYDTKKAENSINEVIQEIVEQSKEDQKINYKKAFFMLWREFNENLKKPIKQEDENKNNNEKYDGMGALWDLLPAETRMPNHSIWHHNRMVSAIAGSLYDKGENSLVLMTIGPVQDFINMARTTADYWAGSYLLSYLSWEGMRTFAEELGPDSIIFPDLKEQPIVDNWLNIKYKFDIKIHHGDLSSPSLPNRWLVICPKEHAQNLAKKAEENIRKKWQEIKQNCAKELNLEKEFENFKKQDSFLEVYWVVLNMPKDNKDDLEKFQENYSSNFKLDDDFEKFIKNSNYKANQGTYYSLYITLIERIMGARKSIRIQPQSEEKGYKCTLCGQREVIHDNQTNCEDHSSINDYWGKIIKDINEKVGFNSVKENEMLCSVCLTKRIINKKPEKILGIDLEKNFPSVTEIAVADFKYKVAEKCKSNNSLETAVLNFCNSLNNDFSNFEVTSLPKVHGICKDSKIEYFAKIDGILLFDETYKKKIEGLSNQNQVEECLKELLSEAEKVGISKPSPYLGFMYFDGDKMGEWISGTHKSYPKFEYILHPEALNQLTDQTWNDIKGLKLPFMPSTQSAISSILLQFSLDVARVITEVNHIGKLIYAGGDDVIIMAPLSEIFEIAKDIRQAFSNPAVISKKDDGSKMVNFSYETIINDIDERKTKSIYFSMGQNATGSAGIAIAHYHNSLKDSMTNARIAEKFAKNKIGRDAFGFALLKRSGEHSLFGAKWELLRKEEKINNQTIEHKTLSEIINMIVSGILSNQFITQLYAELETYFGFNEPLRKEIIMTRAKYLAKRHIHCKKEEKEKKINRLLESFNILYETSSQIKVNRDRNMTDKEYEENVNRAKLENLRNFLSFISFYSRNIKSDKLNIREEANANS